MAIFPQGNVNLGATNAPGVYLQIIPPSDMAINGVPTNILGIVGISSWGPKNSPVTVTNAQEAVQMFGPSLIAKHDLVTAVMAAISQGANNIRCVRVTDGTDMASSVALVDAAQTPATGMTITAIHTGEVGNTIQVVVGSGSKTGTHKITIGMPNIFPEVFDNIEGSGAALWANMVNAINSGQSGRGPSQMVVATQGASTEAPDKKTYTLAGGANGNATITSATLVGDDSTTPRKGMYALRNSGASVGFLADADDPTMWPTQVTFAQSENIYMIMTGASGQTVDAGIAAKATAGIDNYNVKLMLGNWVYFYDQTNKQNRLISQQAFIAGRLANLSPEQSSLNKQVASVIGTQKSLANQVYSSADIVKLSQAGIDVVDKNPSLGTYFAAQTGQNASSNILTNGDEYTRLTNYIALTLQQGLSQFIGQLQSPEVRRTAKNTIEAFLSNLEFLGMIGTADGSPAFSVTLDSSNNPPSRVALGYMQADVQVAYLKVIRVFLVNFQGGQVTVTVSNQQ